MALGGLSGPRTVGTTSFSVEQQIKELEAQLTKLGDASHPFAVTQRAEIQKKLDALRRQTAAAREAEAASPFLSKLNTMQTTKAADAAAKAAAPAAHIKALQDAAKARADAANQTEYETASRYGGEGTFKYRREKPKV